MAFDTPHSLEEPGDVPVRRQPGFLSFLVSRLAAVFAMQVQAVVVAWQVYAIIQDPLALAYVGPQGLGALRSAIALGALLMGIYLGLHSIKRHVGLVMFVPAPARPGLVRCRRQ